MTLRYDILMIEEKLERNQPHISSVVFSTSDIERAKSWFISSNMDEKSSKKSDRFSIVPYDLEEGTYLAPIALDEVGNTSISLEDILLSDI